ALLGLTACGDFDFDLRNGANGFSTAEAARQASADRPRPDARGVISYPDYQVVVARSGDTVQSVAERLGSNPAELARHNALTPDTTLRAGEVLALPNKIDGGSGGEIAVTTLAETAINRAEGRTSSSTDAPRTDGPQPTRHRVERGETAFQIARLYNVSPRALADWNGLSPEMDVRDGQVLLIPVAAQLDRPAEVPVTAPGDGSPTPPPPSASTPMPEPAPPADVSDREAEEARPPSPDLVQERSETPAPATFAMPVDGRIIRAYAPGRNDGVGIAASAGTSVRAAQSGSVAAVTKTTTGVNILVLSHADNLLTVYANIDNLNVEKGARVSRGQTIAKVAAGDPSFLHFEVRNGQESVDPMRYLQ
ncbi:MAG: peptidoglycan DD-metalloendopeptidase family protein, partial [Alphaproteobacteria bacterium]|nr:peptidoglycan DD-metalloendopeptidase family protein [Alphaproteobacteria bacterium]